MRKKTIKCVCHECDVGFDVVITANDSNKKLVAEICPFCGDVCDMRDDRPAIKYYQDDESFDFDEYYEQDDDFDDGDE